jgi:predicted nucleic acid-binding protein
MIDAGILDANILLRVIVYDQPEQGDQVEVLLNRIASGEVSGTLLPTVFLEIVFVLERQYQFDRVRIAEALMSVFELRGVRIIDREQLKDASEVYRSRRSVSFADAYHCAMARDFHAGSIVSFDRKLNGIPGVTRKDPDAV